jgi:hypothetical protein
LAGGKGVAGPPVIFRNPLRGELVRQGFVLQNSENNLRLESEAPGQLESRQANFAILREQWIE